LFSQTVNRKNIEAKGSDTPLGLYLGVDFSAEDIKWHLDQKWYGKIERKEISSDELDYAMHNYNNVIRQISFVIVADKARRARLGWLPSNERTPEPSCWKNGHLRSSERATT
jgi:hypothetical protein